MKTVRQKDKKIEKRPKEIRRKIYKDTMKMDKKTIRK